MKAAEIVPGTTYRGGPQSPLRLVLRVDRAYGEVVYRRSSGSTYEDYCLIRTFARWAQELVQGPQP